MEPWTVHVLARLLDVLARVVEVERLTNRTAELVRQANLVIAAARRDISDPDDLAGLEERHRGFHAVAAPISPHAPAPVT